MTNPVFTTGHNIATKINIGFSLLKFQAIWVVNCQSNNHVIIIHQRCMSKRKP